MGAIEERSERRDKSETGARKDKMGVVNSVKSFLYFWYLQYTLNTSIYMLEPLEQFLFSILFSKSEASTDVIKVMYYTLQWIFQWYIGTRFIKYME